MSGAAVPSNTAAALADPRPNGGAGDRALKAGASLSSWFGSLRVGIGMVVASLVVLIVLMATVTAIARWRVAEADQQLRTQVLPVGAAATTLAKALVDQETGQRGYLLTGDPSFLRPYTAGALEVARRQDLLEKLIGADENARPMLARVRDAASAWQLQAAQPEITARAQGPIPQTSLDEFGTRGKVLFDRLRAELDTLEDWTREATNRQLEAIAKAQSVANAATTVAVVLSLLAGLGGFLVVRYRLNRPLARLMRQVASVADGDHQLHISNAGPSELAEIGRSVERMRHNLVTSTETLLQAENELSVHREQQRMAADLHDLTIQRVFGLGLSLSSLARRHPDLEPVFTPVIGDTDEIIRELRMIIFRVSRPESAGGLRAGVLDVAHRSRRALGFTPTVEFRGAIDTLASHAIQTEILAVLGEALSNIARHARATSATIVVEANDATLVLTVDDNGAGIRSDAVRGQGLDSISQRAARLRGTATVAPGAAGGTRVRLAVPLGDPPDPAGE